MPAPILTKLWNITPNIRRAFTTMPDMLGWFFYRNKTAMLAAGWTVKFTCDGATGPSGTGDTTDRWTSEASIATRATIAGAAQSYAVLQNTDGVQVLLTFQGASDDVGRVAFSQGGLYTLAGTTTHQPTATDEVLFSAGNSLVSSAASADRVMSIWCSADSRQWAAIIFRQGGIVNYIGVERITNFCGVNVFTVPYVGYRYTTLAMSNSPTAATITPGGCIFNAAHNVAGFVGAVARVFTAGAFRFVRVGGGDINAMGVSDPNFSRGLNINDRFFSLPSPPLQVGFAPCYPFFWTGERTTNCDGVLGSPIDWWFCKTNSGATPALGSFIPGYTVGDTPGVSPVRSHWMVSLGSECIRPWLNVEATLVTF